MVRTDRIGFGEGSKWVILRESTNPDKPPALVSIVSHRYQLVQHSEVLESVVAWAKEKCGIEQPSVCANLIDEDGRKALFEIDLGSVLNFSPDRFPVHLGTSKN